MCLAEKFQITVPYKETGGEPWADVKTVRTHKGVTQPEDGNKFNHMPIGYDGAADETGFVHGFGGDTDVSKVITNKSLRTGFHRADMKGTDDQYSGEHMDLYYGEAVDEAGNVGFVERNNYLDRL